MLLIQIERFLKATRMPQTRFGREALGDPCFVANLKDGREPRPTTVKRVLAFIAVHEAERRPC
jgi:hypothetical protein